MLEQISQSVGTIKDMNVQIASASEEQNVVSQQISESVQHVNEKRKEQWMEQSKLLLKRWAGANSAGT